MSTTYTTCVGRCANYWQDWANAILAVWLFISPWVLQFGAGAPASPTDEWPAHRASRGRACSGLERLGAGRDRFPGRDFGDQPDGFLAGIREHRTVDLGLYRALGAWFRDAFRRGMGSLDRRRAGLPILDIGAVAGAHRQDRCRDACGSAHDPAAGNHSDRSGARIYRKPFVAEAAKCCVAGRRSDWCRLFPGALFPGLRPVGNWKLRLRGGVNRNPFCDPFTFYPL